MKKSSFGYFKTNFRVFGQRFTIFGYQHVQNPKCRQRIKIEHKESYF
jgi:hypothetical protein